MMTFDQKQGSFKMYEEEAHKQTIASASNFDNMANQINPEGMPSTSKEYEHASREKIFFTDISENSANNYMTWKYEHTGMKYKDMSNHFIWWMKHPDNGSWYTNIRTMDESHLWIEYHIFWQFAKVAETLDNLITAIRTMYM